MPRPKKTNRSDGRYELKKTIGFTADGKRLSKSFYGTNKAEAEKKYRDYLDEIEEKKQAKKHTSFTSWVYVWLEEYKRPNVRDNTYHSTYRRPCENYIIPYFKDAILQDITQLDILRFVNSLSNMSQSLINKTVLCLRGIFEAAIDNDMVEKNPCRRITVKSKMEKKPKRTYDRDTADRIAAADCPYALFVHILIDMGLRCSEMCGLMWEDIDLEKGTMRIERALTTEGGVKYIDDPKTFKSARTLTIPDRLLARLKKEAKPSGFVALRWNGNNITPDHFGEREMEVFYNALGVPRELRLSPHELRHTCGTLLYEETKDIYHVSQFLGHSDIGITTKIYVHSAMKSTPIHVDF